jgi:hypothetical protein
VLEYGIDNLSKALRPLLQVEAIECAGGQLVADGSRRRSPGGVFWNVVKQRVKPEVYTSIFAEEQAKSVSVSGTFKRSKSCLQAIRMRVMIEIQRPTVLCTFLELTWRRPGYRVKLSLHDWWVIRINPGRSASVGYLPARQARFWIADVALGNTSLLTSSFRLPTILLDKKAISKGTGVSWLL